MKKIIFILALVICSCGTAWSEFYKWVDDKGGVHFSDQLGSIPSKYMGKVSVRDAQSQETIKQPTQKNTGNYIEETSHYSNGQEAATIKHDISNNRNTNIKASYSNSNGSGSYKVQQKLQHNNSGQYIEETRHYSNKNESNTIRQDTRQEKGSSIIGSSSRSDGSGTYNVKQQVQKDNTGRYVEETIHYSNKKESSAALNNIVNEKKTSIVTSTGNSNGSGSYKVRRYVK